MGEHAKAGVAPIAPDIAPRITGRPVAHDSAHKHVTGAAAYIDDLPEPEGLLHLAIGMAPAAAGRLEGLDLAAVRAAPGVVAVFTAADVPGRNDISPALGDEPLLAEGAILFHGQPVFVVAATSHRAARMAARKGTIRIEPAAPAVDVAEGLSRGETVLPDYVFGQGDAMAALAAAPRRLDGELRIGGQEHFYLEGQAALAIPGEDGDMRVFSSTQHPTEVQHVTARVLGLADHQVVVECRRMGGGFGGKESQATQWGAMAAFCAAKTGRPCKIRLDRDDDFALTGKRHDFLVRYGIGFDDAGRITAADIDYAARCGCSADLSLGVVDRTMFHTDNAYFLPDVKILSRRIKTNTVSNTAFRGFGGPQGVLTIETLLDQIAETLNQDPLDIRRRNFYSETKNRTPYGMTFTEPAVMAEIVDRLAVSSDYARRRAEIAAYNATSRFLRRGIALTPVKFGISFTLKHLNQAGALVHVYGDGSVSLNHGGTEMGQGLYVKVAQVVADVFGIALARIKITATTTEKVPNTAPTAASSGSDLNGMAARNAALTIRMRMAALAAEKLQVAAASLRFADGMVSAETGAAIPFNDLAKACVLDRVSLSATGYYATPGITWDRASKTGNPFLYFACGAACSEVIIDSLTGEMKLIAVDILHDTGASLNPAIDIGQIEGAFVQGQGWLTTEELVFDETGKLRTHAPSTYKIPLAADVPARFRVELFNRPNEMDTIFRSKAVGEPPLMLAVSVFSAIRAAIAGLRPGTAVRLDAPATPEAILRAVKAQTA